MTATRRLAHRHHAQDRQRHLVDDAGVDLDVEDLRQPGGTLTLAGTTPALTPDHATGSTGGTRTGARNWTITTLTVDGGTWQDGAFTTTVSGSLPPSSRAAPG